ncbi:hypothetical protein BH23BAC1_BH23BAC1_11580 [soil metagenome]
MATVDIGNQEKRVNMFSAIYELDASGNLTGKIEESKGGLEAYEIRKTIAGKGKENYLAEFRDRYQDWEINDLNLTNLESINESYKSQFSFKTDDYIQASTNEFYINPLLSSGLKSNPFKLETRKFPVDFACPLDETIIINLKPPEGYILDEKPESIMLTLPENTGKFMYTIVQNGNTIQISSKLSLSKGIFMDETYGYLREFFAQIVAKHSEQLVLRKQS